MMNARIVKRGVKNSGSLSPVFIPNEMRGVRGERDASCCNLHLIS